MELVVIEESVNRVDEAVEVDRMKTTLFSNIGSAWTRHLPTQVMEDGGACDPMTQSVVHAWDLQAGGIPDQYQQVPLPKLPNNDFKAVPGHQNLSLTQSRLGLSTYSSSRFYFLCHVEVEEHLLIQNDLSFSSSVQLLVRHIPRNHRCWNTPFI